MKMKSVIAGRIDRPARARPHDQRKLRHHAAGQHIALEHLGIAAERCDAFLNARAARIIQADHRRADLHRRVHHLADLHRVAFRHGAAEHGEILREDIDQPAVDRAAAGHHAVAGDASVRGMPKSTQLCSTYMSISSKLPSSSRIVEPFARGQLALGVLGRRSAFARPQRGPQRGVVPFRRYWRTFGTLVGGIAKRPACGAGCAMSNVNLQSCEASLQVSQRAIRLRLACGDDSSNRAHSFARSR